MTRKSCAPLWLVFALVLASGCTRDLQEVPDVVVVSGPDVAADVQFASMVRAARARFRIGPVQPGRHRFGVYARYTDPLVSTHGPYRFAVECPLRAPCSITPLGPRVERIENGWRLPAGLWTEARQLHAALAATAHGATDAHARATASADSP